MKKILTSIVGATIILAPLTSFAANPEIACSTSNVFSANSCDQCFDGFEVALNENITALSDDWINNGTVDLIAYDVELKAAFPKFITLDSNSTVTALPTETGFWKYTDAFKAKYSAADSGYLLKAGESVKWIESELGYAYKVEKLGAAKGADLGLLVYDVKYHESRDNGRDVSPETISHRECVLYKSAGAEATPPEPTTPVTPGTPKPQPSLPNSGPEMLLIIMATLLGVAGFAVYNMKKS